MNDINSDRVGGLALKKRALNQNGGQVVNQFSERDRTNPKIIAENNIKILNAVIGVCIVFLKAKVDSYFKPDLSYHLHFTISSFGEEYTVVCLDTGNVITDKKNEISSILDRLCIEFVDTLFHSLTNKINDPESMLLANTSDKRFWKKFNKVKISSFYSNMKNELYDNKYSKNIDNFKYQYTENSFSLIGEISEYKLISA